MSFTLRVDEAADLNFVRNIYEAIIVRPLPATTQDPSQYHICQELRWETTLLRDWLLTLGTWLLTNGHDTGGYGLYGHELATSRKSKSCGAWLVVKCTAFCSVDYIGARWWSSRGPRGERIRTYWGGGVGRCGILKSVPYNINHRHSDG